MDYYINEYSLRGQFRNTDDFFGSLRKFTLPMLDKIKKEEGSVIWKKDTFWECKVCGDYSLYDIQSEKNRRDPELVRMKIFLRELYSSKPLWSEDGLDDEDFLEYGFDEEYSKYFSHQNCFTEAWRHEGRIVSFYHPEYQSDILLLFIIWNEEKQKIELDNIYSKDWWKKCPEIKKWVIDNKYTVEIRGKEFKYHPPHFHVSYLNYKAVFHLKTGEFYTDNKEGEPIGFIRDVREWYEKHKKELEDAWNLLHTPITYKEK